MQARGWGTSCENLRSCILLSFPAAVHVLPQLARPLREPAPRCAPTPALPLQRATFTKVQQYVLVPYWKPARKVSWAHHVGPRKRWMLN